MPVATLLSPGVGVFEGQYGFVPATFSGHQSVYLFGTGTIGPKNEPTQVLDSTDFINKFGTSASLPAIRTYFRENRGGILYFVNISLSAKSTYTLGPTAASGAYTVVIEGQTITYTATVPTDTNATILAELVKRIRANPTLAMLVNVQNVDTTARTFTVVRNAPTPATLTATAGTANITVAVTTGASAGYLDYINAIENSVDEENEKGFLIAPQAFATLTSQSERTSVALALQAAAANFHFIAIADSAPKALVPSAAAALAEGLLYTTPLGHLYYYFPYIIDLENNEVPPSSWVAATAIRGFKANGYGQNPAGIPLAGRSIKGVAVDVKKAEMDIVSPQGINIIRYIKGAGTVIWGARSRSSNPFYRFMNIRVVFNVLADTLDKTFQPSVFSLIDGPGLFFARVRTTAINILEALRLENALYGATPDAAYQVVMDTTNNSNAQLEQGIVQMDIYAVPAPTAERILIFTHRTTIGSLASLAQSGNVPDVPAEAESTTGKGTSTGTGTSSGNNVAT